MILKPLAAAIATILFTSAAGAADLSPTHRNYNTYRDQGRVTSDDYDNAGYRDTAGYRDHKSYKKYGNDDAGYADDQVYGERRQHGGWHHHRRFGRIEAQASYASDYLPYHVKEWRAKSSAIDAWKGKVASRYGYEFAHWRTAEDKRVDCDAGAGSVYCTVSATPVRGWSRWSWYGNRDYR